MNVSKKNDGNKIDEYLNRAFWKAFSASMLFMVVYFFYNSEIIRSEVEDIAFDVVNKFYIKSTSIDTKAPQILLFGIDDLYMKANSLYDEYNRTNYGYLFPRGYIADFIERLDELVLEVEPANRPKALFIDYDMSFSSMPYGKALSQEDKKLLDVLKFPRSYTILLPKTSRYNFIEQSQDENIKKAIDEKKIVFSSVSMLQSSDGAVRRYQGYTSFADGNATQEYLNVNIALWQIMRDQEINLYKAKNFFLSDDVIGNRVWFKSYTSSNLEDGCLMQKSNWLKLTKYSANCSLFDIIEEDYAGSIIMLGGTFTQNEDNFNILNVSTTEHFTGIDIHANTLLTLLHLNGPMQRLPVVKSLFIIFVSFFLLALILSMLFSYFAENNKKNEFIAENNKKIEFIIFLLVNGIVLIALSIYYLKEYHIWFNWFVPFVLLQIVEIFDIVKSTIPIPKILKK